MAVRQGRFDPIDLFLKVDEEGKPS